MLTPDAVDGFLAEHYPDAFVSGYRCDAIGGRSARARWLYDPGALRPGKLIAGPTQFGLADVALWFASFTVLGLAPMAVTSDLHITFLRPARGGDLLAEAALLRAGRTRLAGEVRLWVDGAPDRLVSHAVGSYAVLAVESP
jgi:uncharacterized protein (TIGR00369 family)